MKRWPTVTATIVARGGQLREGRQAGQARTLPSDVVSGCPRHRAGGSWSPARRRTAPTRGGTSPGRLPAARITAATAGPRRLAALIPVVIPTFAATSSSGDRAIIGTSVPRIGRRTVEARPSIAARARTPTTARSSRAGCRQPSNRDAAHGQHPGQQLRASHACGRRHEGGGQHDRRQGLQHGHERDQRRPSDAERVDDQPDEVDRLGGGPQGGPDLEPAGWAGTVRHALSMADRPDRAI